MRGPTLGLHEWPRYGLRQDHRLTTNRHVPATADVAIQNANGANLTGVTVAPLSVNANQSDVFKLTATGTFDDGTSQDITSELGWVSSDTTVVAVDSDHPGTFVATLGGSANVTATAGSITSDRGTQSAKYRGSVRGPHHQRRPQRHRPARHLAAQLFIERCRRQL